MVAVTEYRFVEHLPDLIGPEEYASQPEGDLVRIRISVSDDGVEMLGDAMRPDVLERILVALGPQVIEQMLCG
jgi:FtsH ternary system-associated peptide